jgi:putative colanic acid biosynthesis acetyltransferase WcaF
MSQEPPYLGQNCITPDPRSEVLMRWLWAFVQATVFRWSPRPLHGFRTWLLRLFGANISAPSEVVVFPTVRITYPW